MNRKTYSEMLKFNSFGDRLNYLKIDNKETFTARNSSFYKSKKWLMIREAVLKRDKGMDLGLEYIYGVALVHHINPITIEDVENDADCLYDMENLITTSAETTHNYIHYKNEEKYEERKANDTKLW